MARQSIGVLQAYGGKWHLRCRPPYEEQNARISILVNGIAERPDTFVQTVLGQLQKPLADGAGHTFFAIIARNLSDRVVMFQHEGFAPSLHHPRLP